MPLILTGVNISINKCLFVLIARVRSMCCVGTVMRQSQLTIMAGGIYPMIMRTKIFVPNVREKEGSSAMSILAHHLGTKVTVRKRSAEGKGGSDGP